MQKIEFETFMKYVREENKNYAQEQKDEEEYKYGTFTIYYILPNGEYDEFEINTDAIIDYITDQYVLINNIDIDDDVYVLNINQIAFLKTNGK